MVRLLLERGANLDVRNDDGQTASDLAIQMGRHKIVEVLLGFGEHGRGTLTARVRFIIQITFDLFTVTNNPPRSLFLVQTTSL